MLVRLRIQNGKCFVSKWKAACITKSRLSRVLLSTSQNGPTVIQLKGKNVTSHPEHKIDYTSGALH